ncbi:MAG: adenosine deaminase [Campylobacteraceae bacterium]
MANLTLHEFLNLFPKAELHYHFLGGVRLNTMLDLAKKYQVSLSELEAKSYYRGYMNETGEVKGGIAALNFLYTLLRECEDYERVAYEILEDAKNSGVYYVEFFLNPSDTIPSYKDIATTLCKVFDDIEEKWGVEAYLIPSINREKSPEIAVKMVQDIIKYPNKRTLGIGIDYKEHNAPIENCWKAYRLAKENGLHLTGHCSEFGLHYRNVETGLDLIGLERIDHGYTIIESSELLKRCVDEQIPFTVVPSNTFFLKKWTNFDEWRKKHPIRKMAKAGMKIVPATDDWHMHATSGFECYRVMVEDFGFDLDGVKKLMLNGIDAAWQSEKWKEGKRKNWSEHFDTLRAKLDNEPVIHDEDRICY